MGCGCRECPAPVAPRGYLIGSGKCFGEGFISAAGGGDPGPVATQSRMAEGSGRGTGVDLRLGSSTRVASTVLPGTPDTEWGRTGRTTGLSGNRGRQG